MKQCPYCGQNLEDGDRFCGACGRQLSPAMIAAAPSPDWGVFPAKKKKTTVRRVLVIVGAVILIVAVVFGVRYYQSTRPVSLDAYERIVEDDWKITNPYNEYSQLPEYSGGQYGSLNSARVIAELGYNEQTRSQRSIKKVLHTKLPAYYSSQQADINAAYDLWLKESIELTPYYKEAMQAPSISSFNSAIKSMEAVKKKYEGDPNKQDSAGKNYSDVRDRCTKALTSLGMYDKINKNIRNWFQF